MGGREEQGKHSPGPVAFIDEPEGHPPTRASIWEHVRGQNVVWRAGGALLEHRSSDRTRGWADVRTEGRGGHGGAP